MSLILNKFHDDTIEWPSEKTYRVGIHYHSLDRVVDGKRQHFKFNEIKTVTLYNLTDVTDRRTDRESTTTLRPR